MKKKLFLTVMGVTGAGKTTLAVFLAKKMKGRLIQEIPVDQNPFFKNYYGQPQFYFPTQLFFLNAKWQQIRESRKLKGILIQEPPIYEDMLYAQAKLKARSKEWRLYKTYYDGLIGDPSFPKPDLVIFLRLSFSTMLARIQKRAGINPQRASELKETQVYWRRLWQRHEDWIRKNPLGLRIVILDTDKYDFSNYKNANRALEDVFADIVKKIEGRLLSVGFLEGNQGREKKR